MTHWLNKRLTFQRHAFRRQALAILLGGFLALPVLAAPVTLNLKDADINALVESMSVLTGKNFIVDPRVKGRVTIISSKPMDEKELYEVFLAVLGVHGFAAVPSGKVIKIVPAAGAKQESVPTVDRSRGIEPDQIVTRVIQVQNVSAAQIVPILRPLIPPQGHLAAYTPTNVLIISDNAANVERIASIISRIDLASNEEVEIVALRHASATEVVRVLTALEQGKARTDPAAGVGAPTRMVADERTNSILLSGDQTSRVRLRTVITHLDTPVDSGGNTQVIYLRYAKAKDLVTVLQGVSKNLSNEAVRNAPIPGQPGAPPGGGVSSNGGSSLVDIQADETTNALVVTAPPDIIRSLRSVIAQLDIRRAQVLVEAVIAEISAEKTAELGVQWAVDASQNGLVGFTNFDAGTSSLANIIGLAAQADSGDLTALSASRVPQGIQLGAGDFTGKNRFGALISALAKDADTNVLSTPTVVTMDNEEAEIIVGQNVPFVTGSYTTATSSGSGDNTQVGNPFQTIQRDDVGIKLKVKPQINEGNAVKLEIEQEVSSVVPSANAATQGPTTNKRSIKTIVMVEDEQILVLGGLIDDQLTESAQKVPLLGDMPLLGNLFRYRNTSKLKRNLMVFLHPVILRDPAQGTLYTNDKYNYIRQQQLAAREKADYLLPDVQPPLLKPQEAVKEQGTVLNMAPPDTALLEAKSPALVPASPVAQPTEFGFGNK
ncbi:MAG TPA: type II secretion system secretin GspD [Candidatus Competibacteraceae bacterium]|nr:type II secretion system secretin GspD [Candidatus Competibacteraceae bacterium]MCP5132196.1 type II secretion system secretin GspD [Gammaproteobacteria bacterium]HPF59606.1 type II secretion system secretin GspD [Candidatus Competibacteraceae bacterium]HRY18954.1 type II secretion system secretin GspD [Candidatus Competibacteraceae bacterium]